MQKDSHPIELTAPDIAPYKAGNTGIDYVTCFDSGEPGPHVMITAVVHGNELCGAIALDWLFRHGVKPLRGRSEEHTSELQSLMRISYADIGLKKKKQNN